MKIVGWVSKEMMINDIMKWVKRNGYYVMTEYIEEICKSKKYAEDIFGKGNVKKVKLTVEFE